ncbi:MAG TPA: ester cyclase [Roseiflexaceae bacterium]
MSEQNKALMRRAVEEVWNRGNVDVLEELVASDFVIHAPQAEIHGRAGAKQYLAMLREAFPDIHFTIEDQFADGDRVMTRWTARATHRGAFQGIPPTNKQVSLMGTDIDRIVNGKVVECWTSTDDLGLLQQLGVVPAPGQPGKQQDESQLSPRTESFQKPEQRRQP